MPDKEYQVIVSSQASYMMVLYADHLAHVSPGAAERLTDEFQEKANSLARMPCRGRPFEAECIPRGRYRALMVGKWYQLIYRVEGDTVYIDTVIDSRQDFQWLFAYE